jgi:hypothetical protein
LGDFKINDIIFPFLDEKYMLYVRPIMICHLAVTPPLQAEAMLIYEEKNPYIYIHPSSN